MVVCNPTGRRPVQYISTSAKTLTAVGLLLISPVVLLFSAPLAIGISTDIVNEIGSVASALGLSGAVAMFALYKLHYRF
jgi:hypothetical protein